jgi:hypothetical protein
LKELGYSQYDSHRKYAGEGGVWILNFEGEPDYNEGELILQEDLFGVPRDGNEVASPLLYEAQKWLREEKGFNVLVDHIMTEDGDWCYNITHLGRSAKVFKSYEEALSEGIKEAIKILKEK